MATAGQDPAEAEDAPLYTAIASWFPSGESQLALRVGDTVRRLHPTDGAAGWWWCEVVRSRGSSSADASGGADSGESSAPAALSAACAATAAAQGGSSGSGSSGAGVEARAQAEPPPPFGYVPSSYLREGVKPAGGFAEAESDDDLWQNSEYFAEYGLVKIHREMLADSPRTEAYRNAIDMAGRVGFLTGRAVLDVGCGSGILSMFAARAGARRVYAVEASNFARVTEGILEDNGMGGVVTLLHAEVEDVNLPEKVDLIISEWMGTMLIFEFMVESVLVARDRWLAPGGVVWPSAARLFVAPVRAADEYERTVQCWRSRYGFDMSRVAPLARDEYFSRPKYNHDLTPSDVLAEPACALSLDMATVAVADLERIEARLSFTVRDNGAVHGFGAWFDVDFAGLPGADESVRLSTAPEAPQTHWKQDLLMLDEPLECEAGDTLAGVVELTRNPVRRRHLRVRVDFELTRASGAGEPVRVTKAFPLWH